ncbi:hypothetical protein GMORB2_7621 [Geosmithia morbida]|uniref:Uncharacterized protein n=1 Tax=Geosmithia morbida TaxID=1094350 RepID=A0A9P5CZV5_9HYPO|nr:uncharacterized protein GMORB2_7621 [Geosmithia morbida]KAF4122028.1 hypothetical protein GMORB2_7621 [Geosmithia morbida]
MICIQASAIRLFGFRASSTVMDLPFTLAWGKDRDGARTCYRATPCASGGFKGPPVFFGRTRLRYYSYYLVPNIENLDPSSLTRELDQDSTGWVQTTMIDDDDLTFGGKSLSAWHEEDRRRLSTGAGTGSSMADDGDEHRRGRERVRRQSHTKGAAQSLITTLIMGSAAWKNQTLIFNFYQC